MRRSARSINVYERTDGLWGLPPEVMCRVQRGKTWYSGSAGVYCGRTRVKMKSWLRASDNRYHWAGCILLLRSYCCPRATKFMGWCDVWRSKTLSIGCPGYLGSRDNLFCTPHHWKGMPAFIGLSRKHVHTNAITWQCKALLAGSSGFLLAHGASSRPLQWK